MISFFRKKIKTYQVIGWTSPLGVGIPQDKTADMDHEDGINIPFLLSRAYFQIGLCVCVSAGVHCPNATYLPNSFLNISLFIPHLQEVNTGAFVL